MSDHSVNPSQLKMVLTTCLAKHMPVRVKGAPGVGKSDIVAAAAQALGHELLISHPAIEDPTDPKGIPWPDAGGDSAKFLLAGQLAKVMAADKPTVWFIDDLGQAAPAVQAPYMQWLLARECGGHKLPGCVAIVAATNRRADRAGVQGILEPVKSRFATIVELKTSVDDWTNWAIDHELPPELVAFIRFKPTLLHDFRPTQDIENTPCPRTWASVGKLHGLALPEDVRLQVYAGAVGEGAAMEFLSFVELFEKAPSVDAILMNPDDAPIPGEDETSIMYALSSAIAYRADPKNFGAVARYAMRVYAEQPEFATFMLRDAVRRDRAILQTAAFMKLATTELAKSIFEAFGA